MATRYITVRDKKTGIIREVTQAALQIMRNRYELLTGEPQTTTQKKRSEESVVAHVVAEPIGEQAIIEKRKPGRPPKI